MEKHLFVVLTNAVEGQEDTFNEWYTNVHVGDVLKVPGIVSARRFKLSDTQREGTSPPWRYLALYEVETDDLNSVLAELKKRGGTSAMVVSDAMARDAAAWLFKPITPKVQASGR